MNRYLVEISAMMVVDSEYSSDDVAIGIAARLEEIAQSNAHLLDYDVSDGLKHQLILMDMNISKILYMFSMLERIEFLSKTTFP